MTIVHIEEGFHPSYGYQVQNFCRYHNENHDVHVVTGFGLPGKTAHETENEIADLDEAFSQSTGVSIHRLRVLFRWRHKTWLLGLNECLKAIKPDVIFAHGIEYLSLPRILRAGWSEHCVVVTDSHDLPSASHHSILRILYHRFVQNGCVRRVNRNEITTYFTAPPTRELLLDYGVEEKLLNDLPIGTSTEIYFYSEDARNDLRTEWGASEQDSVIIYTGKHDFDKAPDILYRALLTTSSTATTGRLFLVSVGAREAKYFKSKCEQVLAKLASRGLEVITVDPIPAIDLQRYYSAADIAVFPARSTLSCLDAMSCGLPVIMQDDETNVCRLKYGGLVFPVGDVGALGNSIGELLNDPEKRRSLSACGIKDMRNRFDYKVIVENLENELSCAMGHE